VADRAGVLWVDLQEPSAAERRAVLVETFGFQPDFALEMHRPLRSPTVENHGKYVYIALRAVTGTVGAGDLHTVELDCFLGRNYLVTVHDHPTRPLAQVWARAVGDEQLLGQGVALVLHALLEQLLDGYRAAVDILARSVTRLRTDLLAEPSELTFRSLFDLRRDTVSLQQALQLQYELLNQLADVEFPIASSEAHAHFLRTHNLGRALTERLNELQTATNDLVITYLALNTHRLTGTVHSLALMVAVLLSLILVTGVLNIIILAHAAAAGWIIGLVLALLIVGAVGSIIWLRGKG